MVKHYGDELSVRTVRLSGQYWRKDPNGAWDSYKNTNPFTIRLGPGGSETINDRRLRVETRNMKAGETFEIRLKYEAVLTWRPKCQPSRKK